MIGSTGIEPPDPTPSLHEQVGSAPYCPAMSGGHGDLLISPARGERAFSESAVRLAGFAGAVLGWRPEEFWRATPAELAAVLTALDGEAPIAAGASDLARLMEMFPDG